METFKNKIADRGSSSRIKKNFKKLVGDKVILRPFVESDITMEYISWLNDPVVVRYSNQRFVRHTKRTCLKYYDSFKKTNNMLAIILRRSDVSPIGTITAYQNIHHGTADVGILIGDKSVWGAGYGQDAWTTWIEWLAKQKRIRKVCAGTLENNRAMIKIINRAGMKMEAILKHHEIADGAVLNISLYSKFTQFHYQELKRLSESNARVKGSYKKRSNIDHRVRERDAKQ